jgi:hypothetical protein
MRTDARIHAVGPVVRHRHRLGEALRFVVDAAGPMGFTLRQSVSGCG